MIGKRTSLVACALVTVLSLSGGLRGQDLSPKQKAAIKVSGFHLSSVEEGITKVSASVKALTEAADLSKVKALTVRRAVADVEWQVKRLGMATKALEPVPADHAAAKDVRAKIDAARTRLAALLDQATAAKKKLDGLRDSKNYPDLAKDVKQMEKLIKIYGSVWNLTKDAPWVSAATENFKTAKAFHAKMLEKYKPLLQQRTREGSHMRRLCRSFERTTDKFLKACKKTIAETPEFVKTHLDKALKAARDAEAKKSHILMDMVAKKWLKKAENRITICRVLMGEKKSACKAIIQQFFNARKEIEAIAKALPAKK